MAFEQSELNEPALLVDVEFRARAIDTPGQFAVDAGAPAMSDVLDLTVRPFRMVGIS
jgi:hypothetical protein